jgi:hypothetical protein
MGDGRTAMGANSTQAVGVTAFLLSFTTLSVGLARSGVLYYLLALALLAVSLGIFVK